MKEDPKAELDAKIRFAELERLEATTQMCNSIGRFFNAATDVLAAWKHQLLVETERATRRG